MNKYIGKICPYCKTEFKENDDIVVCSVCEMPHHKDCWVDNQGCTTFGCDGTIQSPTDIDTANDTRDFEIDIQNPTSTHNTEHSEFVYCPLCGARNLSASSFCCKCGNPMSPSAVSQKTSGYQYTQATSNGNPYAYVQQGYSPNSGFGSTSRQNMNYPFGQTSIDMDSDLALLVGKNKEYYIPKFNALKTQNKKTSWNWSAFLFTPYWMIYRKMYGYGAAFLGAMLLCSLLGTFFSFVALAGYVTFGILGNYVYMSFLEKKTGQMGMFDGQYRVDYATQNGGTNTTATVLTVIGYALFITIVQFA